MDHPQMTGCFVRAVFGDEKILNFGAVLNEVKWTLVHPIQPTPTLWYCYGTQTRNFLRGLGLSPIMLSDEPFCTFGTNNGPPLSDMALVRHGSSIWRHKFPCVQDALTKYPACIWLDLDTILIRELPSTFWADLRRGAIIQASLMHLKKRQNLWRQTLDDMKIVPTGACIYFGSAAAVDTVTAEYARRPKDWDLIVLSRVMDDMMGGWRGTEAYREAGHEFPLHTLNRIWQVYPPSDPVISTLGCRIGLRRYVQIAKARGEHIPTKG